MSESSHYLRQEVKALWENQESSPDHDVVQALFLNHNFGVYRINTFFSGLFLNEEFLASFGMYNAFSYLSAVSHLVKKKPILIKKIVLEPISRNRTKLP